MPTPDQFNHCINHRSAHLYRALLVYAPATPMTYKAFLNRVMMPEGQQVNPVRPHSVSIKIINQYKKKKRYKTLKYKTDNRVVQVLLLNSIKNNLSVSSVYPLLTHALTKM